MNNMNNNLHISIKGVDLISKYEGCVLKPYNCPAGHATVGIGHLIHKGVVTQSDILAFKGLTITGAKEMLARDLIQYETGIKNLVTTQLGQNQFDALVSFVYNLGVGTFTKSTMLRLINNGDYNQAANEFLKYNKATVGGIKKELPGLVKRRNDERTLFLTR